MGFAISLRSDNPSAQPVRALWKQVERFEDQPSMIALNYPPHITLAIYDDNAVQEVAVRKAVMEVAQDLHVISITFDAIRTFDGPPMVLWAAPRPNSKLQEIHLAVHHLNNPDHCRSYYRPAIWTPHCTLGTRIRSENREAAFSFAQDFKASFSVVFDGLDCISFPPLAPVELRKLSSAGCRSS